MSAARALQQASIAALAAAPKIGGVYDGAPLQAAFPYAVVDAGPEIDWSHKSGIGREVRLAVTIRDEGERPARVHRLVAEAEVAMGGLGNVEGWQLITFRLVRSQVVREGQASRHAGLPRWAGVVEFRARLLAAPP